MVATDLFFFVQRVGCHVPKHFGSISANLSSQTATLNWEKSNTRISRRPCALDTRRRAHFDELGAVIDDVEAHSSGGSVRNRISRQRAVSAVGKARPFG